MRRDMKKSACDGNDQKNILLGGAGLFLRK